MTSHRACYVDDEDPRNCSLAIDLKDVERHDFQAGFLRSSAKVTLHPKPPKRGYGTHLQQGVTPAVQRVASSSSPVSRSPSPLPDAPARAATPQLDRGTWICTICSFPNPVPSNFDPTIATEAFPLPPCLTCGIKPEFPHVLKAAITANAKRGSAGSNTTVSSTAPTSDNGEQAASSVAGQNSITCPRCTFHNHPSLRNCEICGAELSRTISTATTLVPERPASPGPEIANLSLDEDHSYQPIKFSFRAGGDKAFHERLKNALVQRKWLLQQAPPLPRPDQGSPRSSTPDIPGSPASRPQSTSVGIAGLEARGLHTRRANESVLSGAFSDLEALMSSAKEIVALAEKFGSESGNNSLASESAAAMGMIATKDVSGESSNSLYINQLARDLAEYVTGSGGAILRANGGVVGLVDLWAMINRARDGYELISPADFRQAATAWERLNLPVRLREFKSGLLVVQAKDWTDEKAIAQITGWLESLRKSPPPEEAAVAWDWDAFGCGVTTQDAAIRFGWKIGVASEELELAEEKGVLCREEGIEGLKFWLNYMGDSADDDAL